MMRNKNSKPLDIKHDSATPLDGISLVDDQTPFPV